MKIAKWTKDGGTNPGGSTPGGEDAPTHPVPGGLNGEENEYSVPPVIIKDGKAYCTEDMLYPLGVEVWNTSYVPGADKFVFSFEIIRTEKTDAEEEMEEEEPYIPPVLYYNFTVEAPAYVKNKICYMPAKSFIEVLFGGEAVKGENDFRYTATEENIFDIDTFYVKAGDDFALINGEKKSLGGVAEMVDGNLNIPMGFAAELGMNCSVNTNYSLNSGETEGTINSRFHFEMENPEFDPLEDKNEYYGYIPLTLHCWVTSDQVPHRENGEIYVPLYDLLLSMTSGNFTYGEEADMEFVAARSNDYGIKTVKANIGDNYVTVNDEKIEFTNNIVEVNEIIRVPIEFTKKLGFKTNSISSSNSHSWYSFEKDNPKYLEKKQEEAGEDENIYNNWFYQLF